MAKINHENLMSKLDEFKNKLAELENTDYVYHIKRAWPGLGCIMDIDTASELARFWTMLHDSAKADNEAIVALGLNDGTFAEFDPKNAAGEKYYGYTIAEWEADLKTKRNELATEVNISRLEKAIAILEKNMSEDDKFLADMNAVDELIG